MTKEFHSSNILLTFALLGLPIFCYADIVKCQLSEGAVLYSDEPCQQAMKETLLVSTDDSGHGSTIVNSSSPLPVSTKTPALPKQSPWATKRILPSRQLQVDVASVRAARLQSQSREKISVVSR